MDKKVQYASVGLLGFNFMLMFTAFNSLQNMISQIYQEIGLGPLGLVALFCIYGAFGLTTLVSCYLIQKLGYKKIMFFSSLGYALFELTGLLVTSCKSADLHSGICSKGLIYVVVLAGALLCGFSAALIWVHYWLRQIAQAGYVSDVADEDSKGQLFGLFWGLMMGSQILGNIFSTFILGNISQFLYFSILSIIGVSSAFLFLLLPSPKKEAEKSGRSLSDQLKAIKTILKQKGSWTVQLYYTITGVVVACYAGFLYTLVSRSYKNTDNKKPDDYSKDLKFHIGLVYISMGCSLVVMGFIMNRLGDKFNKYRLASFGTIIVQAAAVFSLVTYFTQQYWMCFICAILWGCSDTFLQSNTGALISLEYKGKIEAYSVFRIFFSIGVTSTLLINIILKELKVAGYIFIIIVLVMQMIINMVSQLLESRPKEDDDKESLLSDKQI